MKKIIQYKDNGLPKEQMLSISDVKVARVLFDRWVAKMRLSRPKLVVG
jgi:hypothetical protein